MVMKVSQAEIRLKIDGQAVGATQGQSIYEAAASVGISIPNLCYDPRIKPSGDCGMCSVEIDGQAGNATACNTPVAEGMVVNTGSEALSAKRQEILNTYLADHNAYCQPPCTDACPAGIDIAG